MTLESDYAHDLWTPLYPGSTVTAWRDAREYHERLHRIAEVTARYTLKSHVSPTDGSNLLAALHQALTERIES